MKRICRPLAAIVAAQLFGLAGFAAEPSARIAVFLADAEGKQTHDCPAWNDYRKAVGDGPAARVLFVEMLKAEPELCDAVGGDAERLNDLLAQRLHVLAERVKSGRELFGQWAWRVLPKKGKNGSKLAQDADAESCVALGSVAAIVFVAAHPEVAAGLADQEELFTLLENSGEFLLVDKEMKVFTGNTSEMRKQKTPRPWDKPDPQSKVIQKLVAGLLVRESDPKWLASRFGIAQKLCLDRTTLALALEVLRCPEQRRLRPGRDEGSVTERAMMTVGQLGDKSHRSALAPYLEQTRRLHWNIRIGFTFADVDKQLRDLALSTLIQLSGGDLEQYGFHLFRVQDEKGSRIYLFKTIEERNRGFTMCVQNYKKLGLEQPPQFTPETAPRFAFVPLSESPDVSVKPLPTSPDGKIRLKLDGGSAMLIDTATGQQIGKTLAAGFSGQGEGGQEPFTFICWSFSPDGKYVVTGSSFVRKYPPHEDTVDTNVGRIQVWDAATGELLFRQPSNRAIGSVRSVGFKSDNKTILFIAEPASRDIS